MSTTGGALPAAELLARAADRPLRTRELHPFNAFYGHDAVLKQYAGLPVDTVLKATIEHGLTLEDTVPDIDRRIGLPVYLSQSPWRAEAVERALPGVRAVPIGPAIRYAEALAPASSAAADRRRLVLVPAHSTHSVDASYDVDAFVAATAEQRAEFDETVVCLYWRDVLAGRADDYRRHGIGATTAGHLYDARFLFRLLEILRGAAMVATNEPGTHVAYATLLGVPVWVLPQHVDYRVAAGAATDQRAALTNAHARALRDELGRLFAEPLPAVSEEQRQAIADRTGDGSVRTRRELAEILADAALRYRAAPRRRRAVNAATARARVWRERLRASMPVRT